MIKRIFGITMIVAGLFVCLLSYHAIIPVVFGTKIKATIIAVERVEAKYKKNGEKKYSDRPVFQFNYLGETVTVRDNNSVNDTDTINSQSHIYYSEKYGLSRGFSVVEVVLLTMTFGLLFAGVAALFNANRTV